MLYKIWGFHGGYCEECRLLGYKRPIRTSYETHYVSATEPSRLMLRKIWGFHGSDYEEYRLLRYKNPVRTSQKTHYVSATEPRRLMLYKIWGFHGGDCEECRLLRRDAVWLLMREAIRSSETSGLTRTTRRHVPEDGILQYIRSFLTPLWSNSSVRRSIYSSVNKSVSPSISESCSCQSMWSAGSIQLMFIIQFLETSRVRMNGWVEWAGCVRVESTRWALLSLVSTPRLSLSPSLSLSFSLSL
jgi:hypothetical protein